MTGGPRYGKTSHFWPFGHSGRPGGDFGGAGKELFASRFLKRRVLQSDVGVAATCALLVAWARRIGFGADAGGGALASSALCFFGEGWWGGAKGVALLFGAPLLVVNAWLVGYTWLQHTAKDVAHFDEADHSFVR